MMEHLPHLLAFLFFCFIAVCWGASSLLTFLQITAIILGGMGLVAFSSWYGMKFD